MHSMVGTQLRGLKIEAAHRGCFSEAERDRLDQRIAHLQHVLTN